MIPENTASLGTAAQSLTNKPYLYAIAFLFLLAMHYYQPNGGGQGLSLAFNNTVWIAISVIIAVGLWRMSAAKQIFYTTFDLAGLAVIAALALPLLWAESPWRESTYDRYLAVIAFWLIMLTHRQFKLSEKEQQYFWMIISGGLFIQCIIGLVQYAHTGEWLIIPNGRPAGTFQQVNVYASFLATGLAISIYQLLQYQMPRWCVIAHLLIIFLVGALQWLVFSRTGLLGCVLVLLGLSLLYRQQKRALVKIGLVFAFGLFSAMGLQQLSSTEGRSIESVKAPGYRTTLYSLSWELIKEKPLLGHGLGKFQTVFLEKQAEAYAEGSITSTHGSRASSHPHNEVLFWWVEAGLLPVVILALLMVSLIRYIIRRKSKLKIAVIALPILLHVFTEYPLYHSSIHLLLLAILMAMMCRETLREEDEKVLKLQFYRLPSLLSILNLTITCLFMVTNLQTMNNLNHYTKSGGEPHYLSAVINPFGQYMILNYLRAQELIKVQTPEALAIAKKILSEELSLRPTDEAYFLLIRISQLEGGSEDVDLFLQEGRFLFPESKLLTAGN